MLAAYVGTWNGKGKLTGLQTQAEDVSCKMALSKGNGEKINYSGPLLKLGGARSSAIYRHDRLLRHQPPL